MEKERGGVSGGVIFWFRRASPDAKGIIFVCSSSVLES